MPNRIKYPVIDGLKECGVCHAWKPVSEYRKARNHYASRCKDCFKIFAAEYRQRPEVKARSKEYVKGYRSDPSNRERLNERTRIHRKTPKGRNSANAAKRAWAAKEKQKAVDYKGGKCVLCGYSACLAAMDFHHVDPKTKEAYGTGGLRAHWAFERNIPELDKCVLVCVRCHREIHAGLHPHLLEGSE